MLKYEINEHIFSKKISAILEKKGMVTKKGVPDAVALYNLLYPDDFITEEQKSIDPQGTIDKTRRIRNWINGKNYPKTISDILNLCNSLNCDLDYFFTDMVAPTHDIEFISKVTKLTSDSIRYLQAATEYETLTLNTFLENGYFFDLCESIYIYMQSYYKDFSVQDQNLYIDNIKLQDTEKLEIAEYRATKHFSNLLIEKLASNDALKRYNYLQHGLETAHAYLNSDSFKETISNVTELLKSGTKTFNEICDEEDVATKKTE